MILTLKSIVEHADFADFVWNLTYMSSLFEIMVISE